MDLHIQSCSDMPRRAWDSLFLSKVQKVELAVSLICSSWPWTCIIRSSGCKQARPAQEWMCTKGMRMPEWWQSHIFNAQNPRILALIASSVSPSSLGSMPVLSMYSIYIYILHITILTDWKCKWDPHESYLARAIPNHNYKSPLCVKVSRLPFRDWWPTCHLDGAACKLERWQSKSSDTATISRNSASKQPNQRNRSMCCAYSTVLSVVQEWSGRLGTCRYSNSMQ